MTGHLLATCLWLALVLVPGCVFCLAARRLRRSQGRNAPLYTLAGGLAFAGAAGMAWPGPAGAQADPGSIAAALGSLPFWLIVRATTARARSSRLPAGPIFVSGRRAGLHAAGSRLTRGA